MEKIQTKNDAIAFLQDLKSILEEGEKFYNDIEKRFILFSEGQIIAMINSINHSEDFYKNFFYNKTKSEIKEWIVSESKRW